MRTTRTLIIGAGPYGIALANNLAFQNEDFIIVGKPMELWREHTFGQADLRSDRATSEITHPLERYSFQLYHAACHHSDPLPMGRISVQRYRDYLDWVLDQLPYEIQVTYVNHLERDGTGFLATLTTGEAIQAQNVVVATGVAHHLNIPRELALFKNVVHSYDVAEIEGLKDQNILVIGAGQSAGESMELLRTNGNRVEWFSRQPVRYYSEPLDLPKWIFNLVVRSAGLLRRLPSHWMQHLFGIFSATTMTPEYETRLQGIPRHATLPPLESYDTIVAATGYRYDLVALHFISPELLRDIEADQGMPLVDDFFMSTVEGLHFIGPITEPFFGPPMKFMIGARYAAPRLARVLRA